MSLQHSQRTGERSCRWISIGVLAAFALHGQTPPVIVTTSLPPGSAGINYAASLQASGGTPPYSWSKTGTLPPGLVLNSSGSITGIPTSSGTFGFTVIVFDARQANATRTFTITVVSSSLVLSITTPGTLPVASVGAAYSQLFNASNGTPPYQWSAPQGVPSGMSLNQSTGALTGTPTLAGVFTFPIQVTDANRTVATLNVSLTIAPQPLTITTAAPLFNGTVGTPYAQTFSASGGKPPYSWSIVSGSAGGLILDPTSGVLRNTPQNAGTFSFTVQVTDSAGVKALQDYSVAIGAPALTLTAGAPLAQASVGVTYSQKLPLAAAGGSQPYTWTLAAGSVPGLTFDARNVVLSGVPTLAGTYSITIQVADAAGLVASKSLSLTVLPSALTITSVRQLPDASFNGSFSQQLAASGGVPPYSWSANGLPAGLTLDAASGLISGIPNAAGGFSFAVTVNDSALNHFSDRFSINVTLPAAPLVTISGLPDTLAAAQQFPIEITLSSAFPVMIVGQAILSFAPDAGPADRTMVFASGGTVANFTIPAGGTTAIANVPLAIQTGTVAGTVTITLRLQAGVTDITPAAAPTVRAQVLRGAPVITGAQVARTGTGISVAITGYSTAREVTQATFIFSAKSGQTLQASASTITVPLDSVFAPWYQDPTNAQYGSQFVFTQPFAIQGDANAVIPVSVTLTNRTGSTTLDFNP
jgi:hypothetical protein